MLQPFPFPYQTITLYPMVDQTIRIIYGKDAKAMAKALLDSYGLSDAIQGKESFVLKPNLVNPTRPENGATTHTGILEAVIEYLQAEGKKDITIAESSWVGASTEEAFSVNGYRKLADRYGIRLLDIKKDRFRTLSYDGISMEISETILSADYLINLPVLKGHCQTRITSAMKNLKGCISDRSKREFHRFGLMKPIAALNMLVKPSLTIVDSICGDLDFEEGGTPVETDRMMLSSDPIALDILGASLMGYAPEEIPYITIAAAYSGRSARLEDLEIIELNKPEKGSARPKGTAGRLATHTDPDEACSACYASLIHALKRLDDEGGLGKLKGRRIAVGQGWRGKSMDIGSGACCQKALHGVKGCPPSASDILDMLNNL